MSNLIPPLLSSSPPPITGPLDEDDDDEFGDFRAANSFDCDELSPPPSPQKNDLSKENLDINSNNSQITMPIKTVEKDFQDRRKSLDDENGVNCSSSQLQSDLFHIPNEHSEDQTIVHHETLTEPSDPQTEVPNFVTNCDEIDDTSNVETEILNDFSESVQLEKINSDKSSEFKEDNRKDCDNSESSMSLKDLKLSDDDEFGDFENHFPQRGENKIDFGRQDEDDFGDFESSDLANEDFGDFGDFSAHTDSGCEKSVMMEIDVKNAFSKSEAILKEMFPVVEEEVANFEHEDHTKTNLVFNELKDVTETHALVYQWSKSNSQKMFLKALNIDMRNILYGPSWSSSMPRFLGLTPLEPVKSEILTPVPIQNASSPSNSSQKSASDIPTAQFDWNGSGLINPLDSTSTEPPGNVPEDSSQSQVKPEFLPEKAEPVPTALFEPEIPAPGGKPEFDSEPFQSPKMVPLRETHISNDNPGWLEPTILTPDLPRKEPIVEPEDDDEFDDFQMVLPALVKNSPPLDLSQFDATIANKEPQEHISIAPSTSGPNVSSTAVDEDEEFSDFHSSLPPPQPPNEMFAPLQPVPVEPLKPFVQHTAVPTQINWPDPGVTDEDIRNIELTYSRKPDQQPNSVDNGRKGSIDDDEWSDFVSVKSMLPERTATPDLPLSVLNLNHVQAPKQPIPVITPAGLVQTKLSSNLPRSNVVQTSLQPNMYRPPSTMIQPSTISSQFAASQNQDDDDDWSDFVSSQPATVTNGYQQKSSTNQKPPTNWTNATTNIIMNPTHFDSFQTYVPQQKPAAARSSIPSISTIPDLDFIAPKNRTKK